NGHKRDCEQQEFLLRIYGERVERWMRLELDPVGAEDLRNLFGLRKKSAFWEERDQIWNLFQSRRWGYSAFELVWPQEKKSERFGEVAGRSVVVGTFVASEPRRLQGNSSRFHPFLARFARVEG